MNVSVCIATYQRAGRLSALLDDLVLQEHRPQEIVVVDNDPAGSARVIVELHRERGAPFPIHYDIQPIKNISLTRNRTVEMASGEWLAFIDDDERAPAAWLKLLVHAATCYAASGVLGPVEPIVPASAPSWIRHGSFYDWARLRTGSVVPLNKLRFGNVLLQGGLLRDAAPPFDPAYGLTGGEDGDLLARLVHRGACIVWCDDAIVHEPVEASRLTLRWLMLRSLRGGQDYARHRLMGRYSDVAPGDRTVLFLRALAQSFAAAGLALLAWPRGRHRAVYWLLKACANLGQMSCLFGWHYREYDGKVA